MTKRTKALLQKQEGFDVEFKRTAQAIDAVDLVSFANSRNGGTILVGVQETTDENGVQRGKVIGCAVDDRERMRIVNKAKECLPAIKVDIVTENLATKPVFRLEIHTKENTHRPYCTAKGTYTIRGSGRNLPLEPKALLYLFLEVEGDEFLSRFQQATTQLGEKLSYVQEGLQDYIGSVVDRLSDLDLQLGRIFYAASDAEDRASDAASGISDLKYLAESIKHYVKKADQDSVGTDVRVRAILRSLEIEEPTEIEELKELERETNIAQSEALKKGELTPANFFRSIFKKREIYDKLKYTKMVSPKKKRKTIKSRQVKVKVVNR